jgi:hypothetical protein
MKVNKLQSSTEKNALPVHPVRHTGKASNESKSENKIVSPFCEFCSAVPRNQLADPNVFSDLYGFTWRCGEHLSCPHAITEGPVIFDCMILNRIYKQAPGSMQDLPPNQIYSRRKNRDKRRRFRTQLYRELKAITIMRGAAYA